MFKVGDRVQHVNESENETSTGVIESVLNGGKNYQVRWDTWHGVCVDPSEDLIAITEGPVRTVTRREIVPGVYGRVRVDDHKNNCNPVYIKLLDRAGVDATGGPIGFTAEELRETAHLLNQLAEALGDAG